MKTFIFTTNDLKSRENMRNQIDYLNHKNKGKEVDFIVEIKKNKPVRSQNSNSYYWVILTAIAVHTGDRKEDLHNEYQLKFNYTETKSGTKVPKGTSGLLSDEFTIYLKKVKDHAESFHNITLADPKDRFYAVWEAETKQSYDAMFLSI